MVLWCAIRLGLPFSGLYLLSSGCALVGAAIVLWRSPFPGPLRVAVISSYFFAYQFSVIGRSYSLDLILFPALAVLFAERVQKPICYAVILGLIANANAHGFIAAFLFGLEWCVRLWVLRREASRQTITALLLAATLGLFAVGTAWQPTDNSFLRMFPPPREGLEVLIFYVREAFIDRLNVLSAMRPSSNDAAIGFVVSLILISPSLILFRRAGHGPLAFTLFTMLTLFSILYYAYGWHAGLLFLIWLTCLWISWSYLQQHLALRRLVIGSMYAVLIPQTAEAYRTGYAEVGHVFSAAPQVAADVRSWREQHPDGRISAFGFNVFAVQPWFPHNIFANYHAGAPQPSYIRWNEGEPWKPTYTRADWDAAVAGDPDMILLSLADMPIDRQRQLARAAWREGLGPLRVYPASSVWKGYVIADDTLGVIQRRAPVR